jgi:hypothetical protein
MKTTIEEIRNYVESRTGLDISKKTRKRPYVDARALYFALCRKHTNASFDEIGVLVNRDHSTVVHSVLHCFDAVYKFNRLIRNIYDSFRPILVVTPDTLTDDQVQNIINENIALREAVDALNDRISKLESGNGRIIDLVAKVPEPALDDFFTRVSAMVTMLQATKYREAAKVRELEGAEL